ncbi:MAG TPA: hypothetical protein VF590_10730 [Isosphaeraceae bacterium]|jgi:hypothetical protein
MNRVPAALAFALGVALALLLGLVRAGEPQSSDRARGGPSTEEPIVGVFDRIEAKEIVLRDDAGRVRARLGVDGSDVVRFTASSAARTDAFLLSVFPDGRGALIFRDDRGRNRISLSVRDDGRPVLTLDEEATILLRDARGRNRAVLSVPEDGPPRLRLDDETLRPR